MAFSHTGDTTVYATGILNVSYFPLPEEGGGPIITEIASDEDMEEESEDDDDDEEEDEDDELMPPTKAAKVPLSHFCKPADHCSVCM